MKRGLMSCSVLYFSQGGGLRGGHCYWWEFDWQQARTRGGRAVFWVTAKLLQQGRLCLELAAAGGVVNARAWACVFLHEGVAVRL